VELQRELEGHGTEVMSDCEFSAWIMESLWGSERALLLTGGSKLFQATIRSRNPKIWSDGGTLTSLAKASDRVVRAVSSGVGCAAYLKNLNYFKPYKYYKTI